MSENTGKVEVSESFAEKAQSVGSALSGLGQSEFGSTREQSSLLDSIKTSEQRSETEVSAGQNSSGNEPPVVQPGGEQQAQQVVSTGQDQQTATQTEEVDEFEIDSPITGKIKIASKKEEAPESIQKFEDLEKFAKDNGFEDSKKFITELPNLIKTKEKVEEQSKTLSNYEAVFEAMPPELFEAIRRFSHGEDWRTAVGTTEPIDFSIEYGKQDTQKLVDKYYPGKISQEEWDEFKDKDGDESVKDKINNYLSLVQDKYSLDQEKFKTHKQQYETKAAQSIQARKESLDKSRASVFETFKSSGLNIDEKYVGGLDKTLSSDQAILSIFKNADGTLRTDAHQRLAMASDGFGLVTQYKNAIERKIVTKAREEILDRAGSGSQAIKKTGDTPQAGIDEISSKVKKRVSEILPIADKKTF